MSHALAEKTERKRGWAAVTVAEHLSPPPLPGEYDQGLPPDLEDALHLILIEGRRRESGRPALRDRQHHWEGIALSLARCAAFEERLEVYQQTSYADLSRAAALRPDLMPIVNGEFEWIALSAE